VARKAGTRNVGRAAVAVSDEGVLAGIVDRVFEDPARSGGLMVVAMTATAIICNAMLLQGGHRPAPLFGLRSGDGGAAMTSAPAVVPIPTPAPAHRVSLTPAQPVAVAPPLPRPSPAAKPLHAARSASPAPQAMPQLQAPAPAQAPAQAQVDAQNAAQSAAQNAAQSSTALVTEIQRQLARLGLFADPIDGHTGPRTSAAIARYQTAAGEPVTGQPTQALLDTLRQPLSATAAKPVAPAADPIAAELDQREQQRAQAIATANAQAGAQATAKTNSAAATAAATKLAADYRAVQTALNRIGYGPVPVDGTANAATADAIRGFELDNGLPVSGAPSDALTARLVSIGAIKSN
jgi:peptidoglycan hydrolase-like protein with peptidoglycan-binding domain